MYTQKIIANWLCIGHLEKMVEKSKVKKYNTNEHISEKIHYDEHDIDCRTVSLYTMYIEFSNVMDM